MRIQLIGIQSNLAVILFALIAAHNPPINCSKNKIEPIKYNLLFIMNITRMPSKRTGVLIYTLVSIVFTLLFVSFHHLANQVPQKFIADKLASDFRAHNLSKHNYPFSSFGSHSILSNIGQNQYTECAVLLSVLSDGDASLKNAVLPTTVVRSNSQLCSLLQSTIHSIQAGEEIEIRPLRSRYWWGAKPVYSFMLRYFSVYQTKELIRNTTALAYTLLAVSLLFVSPMLFWVSSPLIVFGILFSGLSYYSDVVLGIPYLWSIISAMAIAFLHAIKASRFKIQLTTFCIGMVSSYVWLLDGHISLLIAWLMMIGYFGSIHENTYLKSVSHTWKLLFAYASGFIVACIGGQIIKMYYLGFNEIWQPLSNAVLNRSSSVGPENSELGLTKVIDTVWGIGYWWTGLFRHELLKDVVLWGSTIALITGIFIGVISLVKSNRLPLMSMLVCFVIILSVIARLYFLQNHSVIHAFFIGRYMFIPLAIAWSILLAALLQQKNLSTILPPK